MKKICKVCKTEKEITLFRSRKDTKDGYRNECIECCAARDKNRYENNKPVILAKAKVYYEENKPILLEKGRLYEIEHPRDRTEYRKEYYKEKCKEEKIVITEKTCSLCGLLKTIDFFGTKKDSPDGFRSHCFDCRNKKGKQHYYENHDEIRAEMKIKRNTPESREKRRPYQRKYNKKKRDNDPCFRLRGNIGRAIRAMLHGAKQRSLAELLPYTIEQLKTHLTKLFRDGMSWENYGSHWELDHKHPQSLWPYDTTSHPNFLKSWDLSNLQPLLVSENREKSDKIDWCSQQEWDDYLISLTQGR